MRKTKLISTPVSENRGRTRVGEAERLALERLAQFEHLNLSSAIRLAIRESCKARGLWPPD